MGYDLKKHRRNFRDITGLKVEEFEKNRRTRMGEKQKKCHGRKSQLSTLEDKIFCVILYYRATEIFGLFIQITQCKRLLKKKESLLARKITIKKDRTLTPERILKMLADVKEQPIQRPKDNKKSYSGKKKTTTIKTEIVIEENGRIMSISRSHRA